MNGPRERASAAKGGQSAGRSDDAVADPAGRSTSGEAPGAAAERDAQPRDAECQTGRRGRGRDLAPIRVYADTSVFGGVFDEEFAEASSAFFDQVRSGQLQLVTSGFVRTECELAPDEVRNLAHEMLQTAEVVEGSGEAEELQAAYLAAGVVSGKWALDALHVALATVARCDVIVSWNFKHIANFRRARLYNAVNALNGHGSIAIYSPREVVEVED